MSKKDAAPATTTETTEVASGHKVVLPNGIARSDFIRDNYYGDGELKGNRSGITKAINDMYDAAGDADGKIPYQIVFAATKTEVDPRIASAEAKAKRDAAREVKKAEAAAAAATAKAAKEATAAPAAK